MPNLVLVARNTKGGADHFPGYLGVEGALWGPFNPEYKPLQLTGKLAATLGDKIQSCLFIGG
jgi:hypothetical protein